MVNIFKLHFELQATKIARPRKKNTKKILIVGTGKLTKTKRLKLNDEN